MKGWPVRVLLCVDMEGISQITTYRELWPEFSEYWESGKEAMTADTLAAVSGLKAGGATAITVCELHGAASEPIIDVDSLPEDVEWTGTEEFLRAPVLAGTHDALFQLGWHARCGTANGFLSHTCGLNVRVAVDGKPVTEVHINGWRTGLPIIGVTGDEALAEQLDGDLEGVPFLPVKRADNRATAEPLYSAEEGEAAIKAFATWCIQHDAEREPLPIPERFVFTMSMPPWLADEVDGEHGLRRTSPAIVAKSVTDWWYEAEPALAMATRESFRELLAPSTSPAKRKAILEAWAKASEPEWLT